VADVVARGLEAPGFGHLADLHADALAQIVKATLRDLGKTAGVGTAHGLSPWGG